jgi:predicted O-linked N-acetylglucosamine transferase (SPINDLY family)
MRGYRRATALAPGRIEGAGSVGLVASEVGDRGAANWLGRALAIDPQSVAALHNLALALRRDAAEEAARLLRRLVALVPAHIEANRLLAGTATEHGNLSSGIAGLRRALAIDRHSAAAWIAIGDVLARTAGKAAAKGAYRKSVSIGPGLIGGLNATGVLVIDDEGDDSATFFRRGLAIDNEHPALLSNLGRSMMRSGRYEEALQCFRRSGVGTPSSAETFTNLGLIEAIAGRKEGRAASYCRRATALAPFAALPRVIAASLKRGEGLLTIAAGECRVALSADPSVAEGHMALGTAYQEMGALRPALVHYRRALAVRSNYVDAERNLLYALLHLPGTSEKEVFGAAVAFARRHEPAPGRRLPPPSNDRDSERPLKVAYVSSDFRDHPNRWFMNAVFEHRDRETISVICYHAHRRHDRETEWIRDRVEAWREVTEMSDARLAAAIRSDAIDIAVYLGGRFDGNRPLVAAYRPAPVQVSYLDGGTSGVAGMDYWLSDGFLHPEASNAELFTEKIIRLPVFYSFTRPMPDLPIGPPPVLTGDGVTFGSFAQPSRVTDEVITVWAEVLLSVPASRLLLKSRNRYGDVGNRNRLLHGFSVRGVGPERIAIEAANDSHLDHLGRYGRIDIALDTFPFGGATTTFEALWMGVPVVTLPGSRFVARMAGAILTAAGHPELIAKTKSDYVSIAVSLARDPGRLAAFRRSLRRDMAASPLCDGPSYARSIEHAYRTMWRTWCASAS